MATTATPTLRFPLGSQVTPGDRLGSIRENLVPSNGTYEQGGHLYASVVGTLSLDDAVVKGKNRKLHFPVRVSLPDHNPPQVLRVGNIILGRVTRLSIQQAFVDILAGEGDLNGSNTNQNPEANLLIPSGEGIIRREDVRTGTADQVKLQDMFRAGDLVLCRIMQLGDRRYVLGTAEPALGVIRAFSKTSQAPMVPISWREMECPVTGEKELRKCAKPPKQLLSQILNNEV
mmetsp:Transcript_10108/g.20881  ORF Transcript_10108/g.20881 Transcript_10108/m.20881 type:complete len:231 (-) Transcript_10108:206-898(-)